MFTYILAALFSFIAYVAMKYFFIPKLRYNWYKKQLQRLGYKVYQFPFRTFGAPYFQNYKTQFNLHGDSLYKEKNLFQNYDVILSNVLDTVCITLEKLDLVKEFYLPEKSQQLIKHPQLSQGLRMTLGEGVIFSEGASWKRKRKIISKAFSFDLLISKIQAISMLTDQMLEKIEINTLKTQEKYVIFQPFNLGFGLFSRVMMSCFFSSQFTQQSFGGISPQTFLSQLMNEVNSQSNNIFIILFGEFIYRYGLTKSHRLLKSKIELFRKQIIKCTIRRLEEIKSSSKQVKEEDLLSILFHEHAKDEDQYSQKEFIQQFCTFLIAGTQTTTNFLRTMLYYLATNPMIQQKSRDQVIKHIKDPLKITYQELKKLRFIDWIEQETIRMAPPAATCFIRIAKSDIFIGDIPLLKDTGIFIEPTSNHYNQAYFKDPHQFWPQRWGEEVTKGNPLAFTGFFGGPRTCLGKHLSLLEAKIALVKILIKYYHLQIEQGGERMEMKFLYGPEKYTIKAFFK